MILGLLAAAREGRSGVLVLRGEPGIGKTALLGFAISSSNDLRILSARAVEAESEVAFAGLQELFVSVTDVLPRLPDRQRSVLAGALALGPAVRGDPLAVRAATLGLLAAVAEDGPLLIVVDDAHWLDSASAEALAFAARRLHSEGIVALFAMRTAQPSTFDAAGLPLMEVAGLTDEAAREVVADRIGGEAASDVIGAVLEVARGNPLALREVSGLLSAGQLEGRQPLSEPLVGGAELERAFARRLGMLSDETRGALLIAAASSRDEPRTIVGALQSQGLSLAALEKAEQAGLVAIRDGVVSFYHPILRSVIYHTAMGQQRRAAHTALAAAADANSDGRAWHLAAACVGPDESVAAALDEAAERASARGGPSAAARAYMRSAALSASAGSRCPRLVSAARMSLVSGAPDLAVTLANEALQLADSAVMWADVQHIAAVAERARGSARQARAMFWDGAQRIAGEDPSRAIWMLLDAVLTDFITGDLGAAAASAGRAAELARPCSAGLRSWTDYAVAMVACARGYLTVGEYEAARARTADISSFGLPAAAEIVAGMLAVNGRALFDSADGKRADGLDSVIATARQRGDLTQLPYLLGMGAANNQRDGGWTRAWAQAAEAAELGRDTGQWSFRAWGLVNMAHIEAARGLEADCREHAAEALQLARAFDTGSLEVWVACIIGLLELSLGNVPQAVDALERGARRAAGYQLGNPATVRYESDLVEALRAAGRDRDARDAAVLLAQRAERTQSSWALAISARCQALIADDDEIDDRFVSALALHDRVPSGFERARTELLYGERLRHARRRIDARPYLTSALATFEHFDAEPWATRARLELQATGAAARPRNDPAAAGLLTAQELRVALVIADGATNREAATQLFLSPKTIEAHLGQAYRKLGVHNRAQLATALAGRLGGEA